MQSSKGIPLTSIININETVPEKMISSLICPKCSKISFPPCFCASCNICYCHECLLFNKLECPKCLKNLVFFPKNIKELYKTFKIKCENEKCEETFGVNKMDYHNKHCIRNNYDIINIDDGGNGPGKVKKINEDNFELIPSFDDNNNQDANDF